ncbi:MAG: hypothetical protein AAFP04_15305, partial [Myxococcota bacterium]
PQELEGWIDGLQLEDSKTLFDADPELLRRLRFPPPFNWFVRVAPWAARWMVSGYRLNFFSRSG